MILIELLILGFYFIIGIFLMKVEKLRRIDYDTTCSEVILQQTLICLSSLPLCAAFSDKTRFNFRKTPGYIMLSHRALHLPHAIHNGREQLGKYAQGLFFRMCLSNFRRLGLGPSFRTNSIALVV